jgi:pimeloyl-ACP methyl ester carboxylesterase
VIGETMTESTETIRGRPDTPPIPCHLSAPATAAGGLLLLLHGRDGAGRSPHIQPIARAYLARGWQVVAPDLPYSRATPESGPPERFTMRGHLEDSRAVLRWARQRFADRDERLAVAGHSVGAWSVAHLAAETADVEHVLGVSPVFSGRALLEARRAMGDAAVAAVERDAPAMVPELEGQEAEPALRQIARPLAVVTGALDGITPTRFARAYFAAAPGACFYTALPGQHHCPDGPPYDRALAAALEAMGA